MTCLELGQLRVARLLQLPVAAAQPEVLRVEHVRVHVRPDRLRIERRKEVLLEVRRRQCRQDVDRGVAHGRRGERVDLALGRRGTRPAPLFRFRGERGARVVAGEDPVRQREAAHRVLRVDDEAAVRRRDLVIREPLGKRGPADQERRRDARCRQILRGRHHLLRALHQSPESPIASGLCVR